MQLSYVSEQSEEGRPRARAGQTASLVSKYRPPQPIMTLVVPQLKNDGFKWHLEGRDTARRCLIQRGLLPVLAAPSPSGEEMLAGACLA